MPADAKDCLPDRIPDLAADAPSGGDHGDGYNIVTVLTKRSDFLRANRGRRFVTPGFILLTRKRRPDERTPPLQKRYGITVTKKIGNAVIRNRMKRRFRELIREILPQHGMEGTDHILIGKQEGRTISFDQLRHDLQRGLHHLRKPPNKPARMRKQK